MISARDRRAIIIGTGVVVLAWLATNVAPVVGKLTTRYAEVEARRALVRRTTEEVGNGPRTAQVVEALRASVDSLSLSILQDTSAVDAEQALIDAIDATLAEHDVRVLEIMPAPDETHAGPVTRVSVRVVLESDLEGTVGALHAVETDASAQLSGLRIAAQQDTPDAEPQTEVLRVEATFSGWFRSATLHPR